VGKPEGHRPLGRLRRKWEDNIKIYLKEMGWDGLDLSGSGFCPVEDSCEHGNEPSDSTKYWDILK
jgi:hypothetical protein